jgi:hypothetical protein
MSFTKSTRLALKYLRRFVAGFVSIPSFALVKITDFPFEKDIYALKQDRYEIASDADLANFKLKQHERKQTKNS